MFEYWVENNYDKIYNQEHQISSNEMNSLSANKVIRMKQFNWEVLRKWKKNLIFFIDCWF